MKSLFRRTLSVVALMASAIGLQAQPAVKVVTVDLPHLLENYYKTQEQAGKMKETQTKAQETFQQMGKDFDALMSQAKDLDEQSKNTMFNEEARKKAADDLQVKVGELNQKRQELETFKVNTEREIQRRVANYQQMFVEEISKIVTELAKKKGATVVLNKSAQGIGPVIYADAGYDITDEALVEINKDKPVGISIPGVAPAK